MKWSNGHQVLNKKLIELLEFIGDLPIIAHNASFDMGFLYALDNIGGIISLSIPSSIPSNLLEKKLPKPPTIN